MFRILHTVDYKRRHKTDRASRRWKRRNADNEKRREKAVCLKKWERPVHMRNVARHKRDKILFGIHEGLKYLHFADRINGKRMKKALSTQPSGEYCR